MKRNFKNPWRTVLAIVLALSMVLSMTATSFAATKTSNTGAADNGTYYYVSLGASQTNGYGMRGYLDDELYKNPSAFDKNTSNVYGYQRAPEGAYPYKLAQYLKSDTGKDVKLDQLAMSSMRAEEVRMLLDNTYDGDAYTEWRFTAGHKWFDRAGGLDNLRKEYQTAVKNADLITIEVGVNNFGVYTINQLTSGGKMFDTDLADVFTPEQLSMYNALKPTIADMVKDKLGYSDTKTVDLIADTLTYAYMGYITNFDVIIEKINELNPDADIVVIGIQNMLYGVEAEVPGVGSVPLGDLFGKVIEMANIYTSTLTDNRDTYMYAEAGTDLHVETFLEDILKYDGNPDNLPIEAKDCFDLYDDDLQIRSRIQALLWDNYKDALKAAGFNSVQEFIAAGEAGTLPAEGTALYNVYLKALNTAYDITAKIMQEGAKQNTIDLKAVMGDISAAEDTALKYIEDSVMAGVTAAVSGKDYEFKFDQSLMNDPAVASVFCLGVRSSIGNSFFAHPNANGHDAVKDAIVATIEKGETAKEVSNKLITFEYEATEDSYYVALGDSTVTGKGVSESYADKVADELGLKFSQYNNLGVDGMTADTLFDDITANKEEIEKADLITLSFGNGQFVEYMGDAMTSGTEPDWEQYIGKAGAEKITGMMDEIYASVLESGMSEDIAGILVDAVEGYAYSYVGFLSTYPEAVNELKEINPDAKIVILSMYNPLSELVLTAGDTKIALGEYIDYAVKLANMSYRTYVFTTENAVYVEAPDVETIKTYGELSVIKFYGILTNPTGMYPSDEGHEYIKTQIIDAMRPVTPDEPVDPPVDPVDPEDPSDPVDPSDPSDPTDPVDPPVDPDADVVRIAGKDRIKTAIMAADALKEELGVSKFDNIIVANGLNFPDALAGSYLAAEKNAPILLIYDSATVKADVTSYIKANLKEGGTVYVLGGTGVVPDAWMGSIAFERLAGAGRYETNLEILKAAGVESGSDILVCTGAGFADSLSVSATGKPILLVGASLTEAQKTFLDSIEGEKYYLIGGEGAVSKKIQGECEALGATERVAGNNRYETSTAVAKEFFPEADATVLAYGLNFPDGLSGGPLAYSQSAPLILTTDGQEKTAATYTTAKGIKSGYILGGPALISDTAAKTIFGMSAADKIVTK